MNIKENEGGAYVQPKEGLTQGVITRIIDVGTSERRWKDEAPRNVHEIMITCSLPTQHNIPDNGEAPEMLQISKWMAVSVHQKAALRIFV